MKRHLVLTCLVAGLSLAGAGVATAQVKSQPAQMRASGASISVSPSGFVENMTLTISGPNGFNVSQFSKLGVPSVSIAYKGTMADGAYYWQLTGTTNERISLTSAPMNNGRGDAERSYSLKGYSESGMFRVVNGAVVKPNLEAKEAPFGKTLNDRDSE